MVRTCTLGFSFMLRVLWLSAIINLLAVYVHSVVRVYHCHACMRTDACLRPIRVRPAKRNSGNFRCGSCIVSQLVTDQRVIDNCHATFDVSNKIAFAMVESISVSIISSTIDELVYVQ